MRPALYERSVSVHRRLRNSLLEFKKGAPLSHSDRRPDRRLSGSVETATSGQVDTRRWKARGCSLEVCDHSVVDQREDEVDVRLLSHLEFDPIGASRSQADSVVCLELRATSANLRLGQSDVDGIFTVEVSDFSFANPHSGAGPEVSFGDHDTFELSAAF
jgi:hypothetical protein